MAESRLEEAESIYRRMLEIRADSALVLNNLAWVAGQRDKPDAIELAERAVAVAPNNPAILDTLGMLQIKTGDLEKGLANLRRAVEIAPGLAAPRLNLARAYITVGRGDDARRTLDEIIGMASEGSPVRLEAERLKASL